MVTVFLFFSHSKSLFIYRIIIQFLTIYYFLLIDYDPTRWYVVSVTVSISGKYLVYKKKK